MASQCALYRLQSNYKKSIFIIVLSLEKYFIIIEIYSFINVTKFCVSSKSKCIRYRTWYFFIIISGTKFFFLFKVQNKLLNFVKHFSTLIWYLYINIICYYCIYPALIQTWTNKRQTVQRSDSVNVGITNVWLVQT